MTRRFLWIMRMMEDALPEGTWRRDRLPATLDIRGLLDRLAHTVGHLNRHRVAPTRRRSTPTITNPAALLLAFFRTSIRDGVFEPRIPCHAAASINMVQVARIVKPLTVHEPDRYAMFPRPPTLREAPVMTQADVERMEMSCRSCCERAFLCLVSSTGLRACAIGAARVSDVWSATTGHTLDRFDFEEKNSQTRPSFARQRPKDPLSTTSHRLANPRITAAPVGVHPEW